MWRAGVHKYLRFCGCSIRKRGHAAHSPGHFRRCSFFLGGDGLRAVRLIISDRALRATPLQTLKSVHHQVPKGVPSKGIMLRPPPNAESAETETLRRHPDPEAAKTET